MSKLPFVKTVSALVLLFASTLSAAANVEFGWDDPTHFRDVKVTNENKARFRARVISELEEQFRREADQLPANQTLHVTVHDVDLAGDIEYFHSGFPFGLRVVRNIDFPAIELSYELRDANDRVIKSGTERIQDLGFRNNTLTAYAAQREPFRYEHQLIKDWYNAQFEVL